ncbi:hypothetical protein VP01_83g13 [Puccinia sorghi]|uniref:Uncharacterized protein n=1 Tax=Puccinia sorghi TaxID=27349 RepID=A0A0L6UBK0_9BASI|nr:hypothetical protein VP01_83g13 [Puccinia sorghi]
MSMREKGHKLSDMFRASLCGVLDTLKEGEEEWPPDDSTSDSEREDSNYVLDDIIDGGTEVTILALLSVRSNGYLTPQSSIEKRLPLLHFRMSRASFFKLCDANSSNHPSQLPVVDQMMVALKRFGKMVRTSQRKTLLSALQSSIRADLVAAVLINTLKEGEEEWPPDDRTSDSEGEDENYVLDDIIDGTTEVKILALLYKAPIIGAYLLRCLEEKRFKQHFRMGRAKLCNAVTDNPMMVALKRFGCDSNGVAVGQLATFFRIGEGTVELHTDWCMVAILDLKPQLLTWPTPDTHKEIQKGFDKVGFEGCV